MVCFKDNYHKSKRVDKRLVKDQAENLESFYLKTQVKKFLFKLGIFERSWKVLRNFESLILSKAFQLQ